MSNVITLPRWGNLPRALWMAAALLLWAASSPAQTLSLTRIDMDTLYGVDDGKINTGPSRAPVGFRITNSSGTAATGVTLSISSLGNGTNCSSTCYVSWGGRQSYSNITIPGNSSFDFYFDLKINNTVKCGAKLCAVGTFFQYQASLAPAYGSSPVSSPQITILGLQAQSRNTTGFVQGSCTPTPIRVGAEFTCTVSSSTGGNADAMRIWQEWPGTAFDIMGVTTDYLVGNVNPPSPDCSINGACGGSNVIITQVATLRALAAGTYTITPFLLDTSGASNHYNSKAGTTITITVDNPTAVTMRGFGATHEGGSTVLHWRTGHEARNLGFRIVREDPDGSTRLVTPELVAGSALLVAPHAELSSGRSYRWVDRTAPAGARYWLEDVDLSGATARYGPVEADSSRIRATLEEALPAAEKNDSPFLSQLARHAGPRFPVAASGWPAPAAEGLIASAAGNPSLQNRQFSLANAPGMKIAVKRPGWYRFTRDDLARAGWDPGSSPTKLQLYVEAQPVPMLVTDLGGASYSMEFFGTGLDTTWTDSRVYWLAMSDAPGSRILSSSTSAQGAPPADFPFAVQRKDRVVFVPGIDNGEAESWFGPIVGPPGFPAADQSVRLSNLNTAAAQTATLEVALQGASTGLTHSVVTTVNGYELDPILFGDQTHTVGTFAVPVSWLHEGTNTVTLTGQGELDYSVVDFVKLTYPHLYAADANALACTVPATSQVTISGFTAPSVRVFDITDPTKVSNLAVAVSGSGPYTAVVAASGHGTRTLYAIAHNGFAAPASLDVNASSRLNKQNNAADLVIVAHPSLLAALAPLQALRQSQGLVTQLIDVTDVYDEFNFGEKSPAALKSFVQHARGTWKKPPSYLLLAGDGSFDPRNYLGLYNITYSDLVPIKLVSTSFAKTSSDNWFVDLNDDTLPDFPIGRLPVSTPAQAATVVAKIVQYDQSVPDTGVLIVADRNDENEFEGQAANLVPLVSGKTAQTVLVGSAADPAGDIIAGFNGGQSLVNWIGHGEPTSWSKQDVFNVARVPLLTNTGVLPFVVGMACLNGYFMDPTQSSLAEALLTATNGGAAAIWASSGLTLFKHQVPVNQALFRALFALPAPRIGDATVAALSATSDPDVRRTWVLLGDPTATFK